MLESKFDINEYGYSISLKFVMYTSSDVYINNTAFIVSYETIVREMLATMMYWQVYNIILLPVIWSVALTTMVVTESPSTAWKEQVTIVSFEHKTRRDEGIQG